MNIKLFYKTQREIANVLNKIIDQYWENSLSEEELINYINLIYSNNSDKIRKEEKYTSILQQVCGKRRLMVIDRILEIKQITYK
ncbi:hypothetical protein HMPREF1982_00390 [Clostridiales bacterium oral taxon 876 str. F0540]|nr:hypothetical protein HMPREF1982_00390 [Clostridiales bacterium oral taxon 876 str. F0540]